MRGLIKKCFRGVLKEIMSAPKVGLWAVIVSMPSIVLIEFYLIPEMSTEEVAVCVSLPMLFAYVAHRTGLAARLLPKP